MKRQDTKLSATAFKRLDDFIVRKNLVQHLNDISKNTQQDNAIEIKIQEISNPFQNEGDLQENSRELLLNQREKIIKEEEIQVAKIIQEEENLITMQEKKELNNKISHLIQIHEKWLSLQNMLRQPPHDDLALHQANLDENSRLTEQILVIEKDIDEYSLNLQKKYGTIIPPRFMIFVIENMRLTNDIENNLQMIQDKRKKFIENYRITRINVIVNDFKEKLRQFEQSDDIKEINKKQKFSAIIPRWKM